MARDGTGKGTKGARDEDDERHPTADQSQRAADVADHLIKETERSDDERRG
jgi:hypothetical protein